ncbi:MAG: ArsR family transcriptional regulator, arsenate/arsenite/antimonite-responsive transcriptional [Clostridia bacterium]|nr:ArsR family transcriptional regulator, arsenate/arsenite/antimonite-responsive transcriptional [Clostridia bacterium]MDK2901728.1 ArsR family transcriptional regulator, arsenate/arsenite/antimonite-responsive transcriptional [Thermosediminibacterales bacterium]
MDKLINFFKILSDETRLRIMILLYHQELCVCEICGILELSQPKVSKHLAKLRDMGFVRDDRQEQFIFYHLNLKDPVLKDIVQKIVDNIENYPVIQRDVKRIAQKEKFLQLCKR